MCTSLKRARLAPVAVAILVACFSACSNDDDASVLDDAPVEAPAIEIADTESFPDVVATVNGTEIDKTALMERVSRMQAQAPPSEETTSVAFFRRALDEIVGAELLYQASREKNGSVEPAAIEEQIGTLRSRFPDEASFLEALAQQGLTVEELEAEMSRDLSIQKLIETDVVPNVAVSDEAKRSFYDENPEQMREPDRLRLSHILKRVPPDATPETKAATRETLANLLEQARDGADFAALAREHSEDPGSAANGGELVVSRGETVPAFEQAAFALEPREVSPVVETEFGFHIIKLSEKIEGTLVPYEQVEPRIQQFLMQRAVQEAIESRVESLKANATVELFI